MRRLFLIVIVALVGACIWLRARDPEKHTLDDAARRAVPGQFVRLPDGITHYDVGGPDSGMRVVLVHGFSVPYYIWDSTFAALTKAGFRVARYDLYGRGYSDRPDTHYDFDLFDRQLVGLLDSLGWRDSVNVMGLSFGGPVSATFVGRHPDRARTLTLVDPAAEPVSRLPWYIRFPVVGPLLWQAMAVPTMAAGQPSDFYEPARWPDWVARYQPQVELKGFGRALRRTQMDRVGVSMDSLYAAAGRAQRPTLLIWGKEDHTVPIANAAVVRKAIPQADFHEIERAGHLPTMERTDIVNPLLIDFLRSPKR